MSLTCACGATEGVRYYLPGPCCPAHTPAALAGHPEPPTPDPERTMIGMMRAAGADTTRTHTPAGDTAIDARNVARGKKRASAQQVRAARAQIDGPRDGATFDSIVDMDRLNGQAKRVWDALRDGRWHTLADLAAKSQSPEASVSARMRDFRKPEYGNQPLEARRSPSNSNLWEYRLDLPAPAPAAASSSAALDLGL